MSIEDKLVMTPQLQMAIRMLSMTQDELFAMIADFRERNPGTISDLAPGDPEPVGIEEQEDADEAGVPVWSYLAEPPLPAIRPVPDVWVFGNPPQARANPAAVPRVKVELDEAALTRSAMEVREASWIVRAVRQRAKTMENLVAAVVGARPQLGVALEPDQVEAIDVRDVAGAMGVHDSTVKRLAPVCRYQTIHGVVQLVESKGKLKSRALW